jgi:hypothetical protein
VAQLVDTNNHGTYRMISAFMPLLKDGALHGYRKLIWIIIRALPLR